MNIYDAIIKRRTIRKFEQKKIDRDILLKVINCARLAPFGANLQPLKYAVIDDEKTLSSLHPHVKWAGYLSDWDPSDNELPAAYIAVLCDSSIKPAKNCETDAGAAVTQMILGAMEFGLGTCWLGAIQREEIKEALRVEDKYSVLYLLALGYPAQEGEAFDRGDGGLKYYFDGDGNVHVPKRSMEEVIICGGEA